MDVPRAAQSANIFPNKNRRAGFIQCGDLILNEIYFAPWSIHARTKPTCSAVSGLAIMRGGGPPAPGPPGGGPPGPPSGGGPAGGGGGAPAPGAFAAGAFVPLSGFLCGRGFGGMAILGSSPETALTSWLLALSPAVRMG